ncbi:MAG: hypothetical protein QOH93_2907 [Chloroflexia bacterium]|nr:hypothetical protein [Chloroflexia bacterium]
MRKSETLLISLRSRFFWITSAALSYALVVLFMLWSPRSESGYREVSDLSHEWEPRFRVHLNGEAPLFDTQDRFKLTVTDIQLWPSAAISSTGANRACISDIYLIQELEDGGSDLSLIWSSPLCFDIFPDPNRIASATLEHQPEVYPDCLGPCSNRFSYPFDDFRVRFRVELKYELMRYSQQIAEGNTYVNMIVNINKTEAWEITSSFSNLTYTPSILVHPAGPTTLLELSFQRNLFLRVFVPAIIGIVLFFILLLGFVDSLGTFVQGGAAVFFGIVALKQVVLPTTTNVPTALDFIIGTLYFAFGIMLIRQVQLIADRFRVDRRMHAHIDSSAASGQNITQPPSRMEHSPFLERHVELARTSHQRKFVAFLPLLAFITILWWLAEKLLHRRRN